MKARLLTKYGSPDVLQFKDVEKPSPTDDEVLIKVLAASVNAADADVTGDQALNVPMHTAAIGTIMGVIIGYTAFS